MQQLGHMQSIGLAQSCGNGMQVMVFIETLILTGINNIETAYPKHNGKRNQNWQQIKMAGNGDVGTDGRKA